VLIAGFGFMLLWHHLWHNYLTPKLSDSFLLPLYQEGIEGCVPLDALFFTHPLPLFLEGKTTSPDRWH
jgi:hypothetical protein